MNKPKTAKKLIGTTIAFILTIAILGGVAMNFVSAAKLADASKYTVKGALTGLELAEAIESLRQLGVVDGTSQVKDSQGNVTEYTFGGDSLLTRQELALFTAKIATALPQLFVVAANADVKTNTTFKDLVDKAYIPAIDHCFGEGYMLGMDEENTIFNPLGNVTLVEAVAALTKALGYTGLSYPTGYMTKASDSEVRLIGEYADFPMSDVAQNAPINKTQMAMLLWNFLLGERWELEMVYNSERGQWDAVRKPHAILETFGIKRTDGYVTAVPNWSATLDIVYGSGVNTLIGGGLSSVNNSDICVSPRNGSTNVVTTMDRLGLSKYKNNPLYLLGLKVTIYEDKRVNPGFNITIPAIVRGVKIDIDIREVDGAVDPNNGNVVTSLSIPFPAIEDVFLSKSDFTAAQVANLYRFGTTDARLTGVKAAEREPNTVYFAQKAASKTGYKLELVYNGLLDDGTPEYFYIFRPSDANIPAPETGYIYDTIDPGESVKLPVQLLPGITNQNTAIAAIQEAANGMTDEQKQSATGIDLVTLFAEEAVAQAASTTVRGNSVTIDQAGVQAMHSAAASTKAAAEQALTATGVETHREISTTVKFKVDSKSVMVTIDPSAKNVGADNVRVEAAGFAITFSAEAIAQNAADTAFVITIIETAPNAYAIEYNQPVNEHIKVALPPISGDPTYQAIIDADGNAIGGKHNPVTGMLEAKTNPSQTLTVKENKKDFSDISGKSAEMQKAINVLASKDIINGMTATTFAPDSPITRAQIAQLIVKTLSKLDMNADGKFSDVKKSD